MGGTCLRPDHAQGGGIRGPQSTGLVMGKAEWVAEARKNCFPNQAILRAAKVREAAGRGSSFRWVFVSAHMSCQGGLSYPRTLRVHCCVCHGVCAPGLQRGNRRVGGRCRGARQLSHQQHCAHSCQ